MKIKSLHSMILTIFFCMFLSGGLLLSVILPTKTFSETENRYLAQKPGFTWESLKSGAFGTKYEEYLSDQFPFRDSWIGFKTAAQRLQLKKEINGVWLGKNGYLIEALYEEDIDRELYEKNTALLWQFAAAQEKALGSGRVKVMLVPSASEILSDKLPSLAAPFSQKAVTDRLAKKGIGRLLVPVRDALLDSHVLASENAGNETSSASPDSQLYYRTDHHWTTYGAYVGYQAWAESMDFTPWKKEDFSVETVTDEFLGTIHSKLNIPVQADLIQLYRPKNEPDWSVFYDGSSQAVSGLYSMEALETRDKYRVFLDGNHGLTSISNPDGDSGRNLLIIKDSYAHCFAPFAALHFGKTHMLDLRYYNGNVGDFIEEQKITDLLVLYQIPGFVQDRSISKLKTSLK